jgi:hypothetical protein
MNGSDRWYAILEIRPGVSRNDLRQAYRDLVKVWHPDRFAQDPRLQHRAQEKLKEINQAYEILMSPASGSRTGSDKPGGEPHKTQSGGSAAKRPFGDPRVTPAAPSGRWKLPQKLGKLIILLSLAGLVLFLTSYGLQSSSLNNGAFYKLAENHLIINNNYFFIIIIAWCLIVWSFIKSIFE